MNKPIYCRRKRGVDVQEDRKPLEFSCCYHFKILDWLVTEEIWNKFIRRVGLKGIRVVYRYLERLALYFGFHFIFLVWLTTPERFGIKKGRLAVYRYLERLALYFGFHIIFLVLLATPKDLE